MFVALEHFFSWQSSPSAEGEKVGRMLSAEASHGRMLEGRADQADEEVTFDFLIAIILSRGKRRQKMLLGPDSCNGPGKYKQNVWLQVWLQLLLLLLLLAELLMLPLLA